MGPCLLQGPSERWRYDKLRLAFPVAADPSERDEDTDKRVTLVAALGLPVSMELGACPADSERIRKMSGKEVRGVPRGALGREVRGARGRDVIDI